jgi:hypothetical protein
MAGARIDHDERSPIEINFDAFGRNDAHKGIIHRLIQLAAVDEQFRGILQDMWRRLRDVFPVLIAASAQNVQEQDAALARSPSCTPRPKRQALISGRPAGLRFPSTYLHLTVAKFTQGASRHRTLI